MRIAIITDIHGNDIALQAVLEDIHELGGVDEYWVLGDLVAIGPRPVQVLERLNSLPKLHVVRGNTDRYVCHGDRPPPTVEQARAEPELIQNLLEMEADFAWTQGAVTVSGWFAWLDALPLEHRCELPDGSRVLCVHASPGMDDGPGVHLGMNQEEIAATLRGCEAELIFVGHSHSPFDLRVADWRVVNPGSVSNPVGRDVRACYALLQADEDGYEIELRRVAYDVGAVLEELDGMRHPAQSFISKHLRGERLPGA